MKRRAVKPDLAALAQAKQDRGLAATKAGIVGLWKRQQAGNLWVGEPPRCMVPERCRYRLPPGLAVVREDQVNPDRHRFVAPFVDWTVDRLTEQLCAAGSEQALADWIGREGITWWTLIAAGSPRTACLVRVTS